MTDALPLRTFYQSMQLIRLTEEAIASQYPDGNMRCPTHLSIGQEAVAVGVCKALLAQDTMFSTHRAHAHYLAKGGNLDGMLAELHGKSTGCARGRGGSMHLIDLNVGFMGSTAIVANSIPLAAGSALSHKLMKNNQIACSFFGDGSTEEGAFYETLNFAVVRNLPVLFICENNFYSVYTPLADRQPANRSISEIAQSLGLVSSQGDGNDVCDVYRQSAQAVEDIKLGKGPRFLEFFTYRWLEHCGPFSDQHLGYRPDSEFNNWKARDPIAKLEKEIVSSGIGTTKELTDIREALKEKIEKSMKQAQSDPFPTKETLADGVFKTSDSPWSYLSDS